MKDEYCSYCGALHASERYPKTCLNCENITWSNPIPVVVCVQPILDGFEAAKRGQPFHTVKVGILVARRAIEPHIGGWALVGGHMEHCETVVEAARREFREEMGIEMGETDEESLYGSYTNGRGHVLLEVRASALHLDNIYDKVKLCAENSEWSVIWNRANLDLCFPIHQEIAERFFDGN